MRILHVTRQYLPGVGGMEDYVRCLAREQSAQHSVSVLTLDKIFGEPERSLPKHEVLNGVEVDRIPYKGSERYPFAPQVLRHLQGADIVHVHGVDFFADFLAATTMVHRKPLVLSTHGGFFHTSYAAKLKRHYFNQVTRRSLKAYRAVIACSQSDHQMFSTITDDRLVTVENGVDVEKFAGLGQRGTKNILNFGRIAPNKEPEKLLRWFASVYQADPEWRLVIAGKPMGVDIEALHRITQELGLDGAVEIVPSPSDAQLANLISKSSVYASAASHEGFGIAAVEAASAGLYPILSDIAAHQYTRARLGFGMLETFDDPASPQRFLDQHKAGAMVAPDGEALRPTLQSFGWSGVSQQIDGLYDTIMGTRQRSFGGVDVPVMDAAVALTQMADIVKRGTPQVVAFCNAHTVNVARKNSDFSRAMNDALVLNDGAGIDIASKLLYGRKFPANLNGTDLVPLFLQQFRTKLRVYLIGSAPGIAARAGQMLQRINPQLQIVGADHGFFGPQDEELLKERVRLADPDLVLVGMGQPQQELWANRNVKALGIPIICVGGLIDFLAEAAVRAPEWMRAARLEWTYRLYLEPRRLAHRYLVGNITFLAQVANDARRGVRLRSSRSSPPPRHEGLRA
ncbi:polysaccharide biosynthesis protein GumH [Sphingobium sp. SCG-1]|uniref:WecB/TagA/CpsF family glycosyltransferase n=1 Tax=Sphingobium sp. SCG-1 TaxID=2072936 RepID=UPI000CD6BF64|nr:WecB/TagA/CpsF family glycosyltransferase [Sphingobium sp. SCG-1]AUW58812.1 polysaccharide biosynthesis protein GumH [Sphingobium sp. SCG-1]